MISAYVTSNGEWIAKCIIQGFFNSPIEALPEISVTDVVRIYERWGELKRLTVFAVLYASTRHLHGYLRFHSSWQQLLHACSLRIHR
jgi:hypothetical protein